MLALILVGAADSVSTIIRNTIRQLQTPDYIRGRMTSVNQIFFMGGPQLGEVEAGVVAQLFSAPFAIISGGIGCLVAVAWIVAPLAADLRTTTAMSRMLAGAQRIKSDRFVQAFPFLAASLSSSACTCTYSAPQLLHFGRLGRRVLQLARVRLSQLLF